MSNPSWAQKAAGSCRGCTRRHPPARGVRGSPAVGTLAAVERMHPGDWMAVTEILVAVERMHPGDWLAVTGILVGGPAAGLGAEGNRPVAGLAEAGILAAAGRPGAGGRMAVPGLGDMTRSPWTAAAGTQAVDVAMR